MKKALLILVLACTVLLGRAQVPCDSVESVFRKWNARLDQLNTEDPEIISLHYLFLQDILKNMDKVGNQLNTTEICLYVSPHIFPKHIRNNTHKLNGNKAKSIHLFFFFI